jgi:RNA polymerase sigma factor (sigma-70 family)
MIEQDIEHKLRERHKDSFGWALHCCNGNQADAEDVLQTVYLKILEGKAKYEAKSAFKTWLFSVIRFTAIDAQRSNKQRQQKIQTVENFESLGENNYESEEPHEPDLESFKKALNQLPDRQREVLILVFYQEMSIAEAAEVIGVSLGTARTHYERGKEGLRKTLKFEK